jgi:hypothetical protein
MGVYFWVRFTTSCFVYFVLTSHRSSNKMPAGVRAALVEIAREEGKMGEEEAHAYIVQMEKEERLFEECWS